MPVPAKVQAALEGLNPLSQRHAWDLLRLGQRIAALAVDALLAAIARNFVAGTCRLAIRAHQHHIADVDRGFLLDTARLRAHAAGRALVLE